jgi:hypothetical protein
MEGKEFRPSFFQTGCESLHHNYLSVTDCLSGRLCEEPPTRNV